jgi:tetratricopeptide (TPR) repeat protein
MLEGKVINNQYYLNKLLGAGGYGGVFLADDVIRDKFIRQVAIKLITPDNNNEGQLNELIAATNLQHPNLIRCFYGGESSLNGADFLYLVMEVADFSLEKQLTQTVLSETETTLLVQDIAEALVYLHNQPKAIVHRDLKPGNILRVGDKWKLSDFGLVKVIGKDNVVDTINLMGTTGYAPPEAYQGKVATAWDVWSLGIIIVEALTGKSPFPGNTPQQLQQQICNQEPNLSGLPQKFEPIVKGCLEKDRKKRWTAQQVLDVLSGKTKQPEDAIAYYNRGNVYYDLGEKQKALEDYNQALKLDPNLAYAYNGRGNVYYYNLGENQKALEDYNQALKLDPNFAVSYNGRGNVYYNLGEKQKALEDYNQALKLDPNLVYAYHGRGNVYYDLGEKQKALEDYQKAAQLFQQQGNTYWYKQANNRIKELSRGIWERIGHLVVDWFRNYALSRCTKGLRLLIDPRNDRIALVVRKSCWLLLFGPVCYMLIFIIFMVPVALAYHYNDLGEKQKALEVYNLALKSMPSNIMLPMVSSVVYYARGNVYFDLKEKQKALEDYNLALKLNPNLAVAYNSRGIIYDYLGEKQKALEDYNLALKLDPNLDVAYYNRGLFYDDVGEKQKALEDYQKAAQLFQKHGKTNLYERANNHIKELSRGIR